MTYSGMNEYTAVMMLPGKMVKVHSTLAPDVDQAVYRSRQHMASIAQIPPAKVKMLALFEGTHLDLLLKRSDLRKV